MTRTSFAKARVLVASAFASLAVLAVLAPVASAGPLVASAPDCSSGGDPVFAPWLDPSSYVIDQGGAFEDGATTLLRKSLLRVVTNRIPGLGSHMNH